LLVESADLYRYLTAEDVEIAEQKNF
jgi:hypothetical protein